MIIDFTEKTILITGGSGGIGRAICQAFAKANGTVAVHYNSNEDGAKSTLQSLEGEGHSIYRTNL